MPMAGRTRAAFGEEMKMATRSEQPPPWKRKSPKKQSKPLTTKQRAEARARAKAAGRKYPNLVDNMAVAARKKR